jgi:hypothetical protein
VRLAAGLGDRSRPAASGRLAAGAQSLAAAAAAARRDQARPVHALLVCCYFVFALLYLRPYKKQAKQLAKELLDKVKVPHD